MSLKKILYVHHAGGMGGSPRSLAFLIKQLDKSKFSATVWMMENGPAADLFREAGAEVLVNEKKGFIKPFHGTIATGMSPRRFARNMLGFLPTYRAAKELIKSIEPDIVHLNTTCLFHFAMAAKKQSRNIKVVSHVREVLLPNIFGRILLEMNSKYVDKFIAISKNDAKPFLSKGKDVKVVFNFVDLDVYKKDSVKRMKFRDELNLSNNDVMISFFARIDQLNGAEELIKIAEKLKHKNNLKFIAFGYTGASDYERNIKNIAPSNVKFMPMINNVMDYLTATDILISPFIGPHFSRAVVEASAVSVPSVVSNVGSQNELIIDEETGYLYDTTEQAIQFILKLSEDKSLREKLGSNARKFAEQHFSSVKNSIETFKVYG